MSLLNKTIKTSNFQILFLSQYCIMSLNPLRCTLTLSYIIICYLSREWETGVMLQNQYSGKFIESAFFSAELLCLFETAH